MDPIILKTDAELNAFVNEITQKVADMNEHAVKIGDIELIKTENAELKAALEVNTAELAAFKELQSHKYAGKSEDEKMYNLGKFLFSMRHKNNKVIDKMGGRLQTSGDLNDEWKAGNWNINAATDLGTPLRGDATTGSYLVPDEIAAEVLRIPTDPSAMMGQVRTVPMSVRKISYPGELAGASFTWVTNEVTAKTETNPTFNSVDLECETAAAWIAFTEEMNEDSLVNLGAYFTTLLREAWQTEFDTQCLNSSAAPFTGVLQNTGANVLNLGAGKTSFDSVTFDDMKDLVAELDSQGKRNGAKFIMHVTILDIFKGIKDDNGRFIWQEPAGNTPGTIMGYEYILSDAMPDSTDSAVSTAFIAYGNPKHILHGNRVGMEFKLFDQTSDGMVYDRLFLRARLRQAFVTGIPAAFAVMKTAAA